MSYCFNPNCSQPHNSDAAKFCQNCGSKLLLSSSLNGTNTSNYQGLQLIGQGGFGRTFLAVDINQPLQPRCVIKQFFPQTRNAQKASELFEQEAQQLQILGQHSQIPTGLDYFEQEGYQYLVQEFIAGKNLEEELLEKGAFDEAKIRALLNDLLPVLQFVHNHKVIHRDIKPDNIIRRFGSKKSSGNLVLVDFGAAKLVTGGMLPKTGTMIGSAAYTAPEQLMGKADFASDIYSLGVSCIHLLTNIPPFDLFDSQEGNWAWRDYLKTPVSDELGQILDKMLQGARSRRYHSVAAVLRQLNPRPDYVQAMPGLKINSETGFEPLPDLSKIPLISNPEDSAVSTPKPIEFKPFQSLSQTAQIQNRLEKCLESYGVVQVKVNQTSRHQLTVVLNRGEKTSLDYKKIGNVIGYELTEFQVNNIQRVKILGRMNNSGVPEWQSILKLDSKTHWRNKWIRFKNSRVVLQVMKWRSLEFWLNQVNRREFWLDLLMFAMIVFIFTQKIIIFKPLIAVLIAGGFLGVKTQVSQTHDLEFHPLFATLTTLFLMFGWLDLRIWVDGLFGIILAGLFVSLPVFFSRSNC